MLFFVVGDIIGTTIYALTGKIAGKVGGALWVPFLIAFAVAFLTACSYMELVGKYPKAGGAPLYIHRAFGIRFVTFLVAFGVMCSGITSAASGAQAFSGDYLEQILQAAFNSPVEGISTVVAVLFIVLVGLINFRGVAESTKLNVVLTSVVLFGLAIVIVTGAIAVFGGSNNPDVAPHPERLLEFKSGISPFFAVSSATALAFFAMIGFEDTVNMAEETKNPQRTFPRAVLLGMGIVAVIYTLIALITSTLVPTAKLAASDGPLLLVVQAAAPWFPPWIFAVLALFALSNTALINMMMASRLLYGMAGEQVVPRQFGLVHHARHTPWVAVVFTSVLGVILVSSLDIEELGDTTSLLLLIVFAVVNIAVLVLRRDSVAHQHFRVPKWVPVLGAITCVFFASPLAGREGKDYAIVLVLLAIGVVFWLFNHFFGSGSKKEFDPGKLDA